MSRAIVLSLMCLAPLMSCAERPPRGFQEGCAINSDCASPLGCRIGSCRRICVQSRDCGAGLRCLIEEGEISGGCQYPEEATCALTSECPQGFDCVHATCTLSCVDDEDCPVPGSACREELRDDGSGTGIFGCNEPLDELCIYDSDCPEEPFPFVCAFDGTCQVECAEEGSTRDCPPPRVCRGNLCELP